MRTTLSATACAALALLALPSAAAAKGAPPPTPTVPAPAPAPPAAPVPGQAPGKIRLVLQKVGGSPLFAVAGRRFAVRGIVLPYVAGQRVKLSFYREGHKVAVQTLSVLPLGNGAGQFHAGFTSHDAGLLEVRAAHYATPQQAAFAGRSRNVRDATEFVLESGIWPTMRRLSGAKNFKKSASGVSARMATSCVCTAKVLPIRSTARDRSTPSSSVWWAASLAHFLSSPINSLDIYVQYSNGSLLSL